MDVILWWCLTPYLLWYPCSSQEIRQMLHPSGTRVLIANFFLYMLQPKIRRDYNGNIDRRLLLVLQERFGTCTKSVGWAASSTATCDPTTFFSLMTSHPWWVTLASPGGKWTERWQKKHVCLVLWGKSQCLHICSLFRDPNARWGH